MAQRALVAVHDPRGGLSEHALRARFAASMAEAPDAMLVVAADLAATWSGGAPDASASGALLVVDGDWPGSPPPVGGDPAAALAALRGARGAFALLAWDPATARGLVARDHLGARPLFWATSGPTTYVASEVTLLLELLSQRPPPDDDEVARRLAGRRGAGGQTLYRGIRELAPAHALLLGPEGAEVRRYWRPEPRADLGDAGREEAAAAVRDAIAAAIGRGTAAARAPAVLVSGGVDSSAVFAVAAEQAVAAGRPAPVGFSASFPAHPELDESEHATTVARRWGAELVGVALPVGPITPYAGAYLQRWSLPLEHGGGALFAGLHEAAAARGADVLIDGEGGDELFGCEPFLIADRLLERRPQAALALTRELPGMERLGPRALRVVARNWLAPAVLPPRAVEAWRARGSASPGPAPEWMTPSAAAAARHGAHGEDWRRPDEPRWRAHLSWLLTDARTALGVHDHLRRTAAMAGVHDVHPLLDVDLVELVLGLPPELHFERRLDRPLLREAMRGLVPEPVRLREDKVFFNALLREAVCGPDRAAIEATLTTGALELAGHVDRERLVARWRAGPDASARGASAWVAEMWRVFALESWLRREAGH